MYIIACSIAGLICCFLWVITTAHFDPPGNFWAGIFLAFAVPFSPVVWIVMYRYSVRGKNTDPEGTKKIIWTLSLVWAVGIISLTCAAYARWSPMTFSMRNEYKQLTTILLNAEIAINKRDINGQTPLGLAIQAGDLGMTKQLIDHGADVNLPIVVRQPRTSTKYAPLKLALWKQDAEIIKLLRQAGAKEQ